MQPAEQNEVEVVNKYHARTCMMDSIRFDSLAERDYYIYLKSLLDAGEISELKVHPKFVIVEGFEDNAGRWESPVVYEADFSYCEHGDIIRTVVCDVKSSATKTRLYQLKKKLFKQKYPHMLFKEELSG